MITIQRWLCLVLWITPLSGQLEQQLYAFVKKYPYYVAGGTTIASIAVVTALSLLWRTPPHLLSTSAWSHFQDNPNTTRYPLCFTEQQDSVLKKLSRLFAAEKSSLPVEQIGDYQFLWNLSLQHKKLLCATIVALKLPENTIKESLPPFISTYVADDLEQPQQSHIARWGDIRIRLVKDMPASHLTSRFAQCLPQNVPLFIIPIHPFPHIGANMQDFLCQAQKPTALPQGHTALMNKSRLFIEADNTVSPASLVKQYHTIGIPLTYEHGTFWLNPPKATT